MFNKRYIEELETRNQNLELEKDRLIHELAILTMKFEKMGELKETEPADCKRGPWCKGCMFSKSYHYVEYIPGIGRSDTITAYMCSKGDSCKHFVQMEINQYD